MKNIDKQQLIIYLFAVVLAGGFAAFRYVPIMRQKIAINDQMEILNTRRDQVNMTGVLVPELRAQADRMQQQLDQFTRKVPEGRSFSQLWNQIADIMNACELTDQLVQPGAEIRSGQLCCIPLTIECKGTMGQIFQFFQGIENVERLLQVEQASFENTSDLSGLVTLNTKVNVYYQPETLDNG